MMNVMETPPDRKITIQDIDIPFGRMVGIMLKVMVASIPAVLIFYAIFGILAFILMAIFGGGAALLQGMSQP
jgi:hypothetical protein